MQTIYDDGYRRAINLLVDTRHKLGLTQLQVAQCLGWRRTMLSNVENFERRLDLLEAYKLVQVLGLRLADLEVILQGSLSDNTVFAK